MARSWPRMRLSLSVRNRSARPPNTAMTVKGIPKTPNKALEATAACSLVCLSLFSVLIVIPPRRLCLSCFVRCQSHTFMQLIEHLNIIEELVLNRASPAEIRPHLLAIRPALETYDEQQKECATLRSENAQLVQAKAAVDAELAKMKAGPTAAIVPRRPGERERQVGFL